jgi:hypothetical protein
MCTTYKIFDIVVRSQDGVLPHLLNDKGTYLLLFWFMAPNKIKGDQIQFWNYCTTTNTKGACQLLKMHFNAPPSSLMDSTSSPKVKTAEGEGIGVHSLACNTSRVKGRAGTLGWD